MNNIIYYNKFINEKRILESYKDNYNDALRFMVENINNADIVVYDKIDNFLLLSVGVLKSDNNNNYYYEYSFDRQGDIVDNIKVECPNGKIKKSYYIGGIKYDPNEIEEFIIVAAPYHDLQIRITFLEEPTTSTKLLIYSRIYLINNEDRIKMRKSKIITRTNIYNDGMCGRLNDFTKNCGSLDEYKAYIK